MYASILVPLDGSRFAEEGLPLAIALARRSGARLHLVTVRTPTAALLAGLAGHHTGTGRRAADPEQAYLDSVCDRICDDLGESVSFELLDPPVVEALDSYAVERGVDLIVMTTHGRGGLSRAWLGSVADALVRRSNVPILLRRPGHDQLGERPRPFRHVLVPLDGSRESEEVLDRVLALTGSEQTRYTLLRIVQLPFLIEGLTSAELLRIDTEELDRRRADAERYLKDVVDGIPDSPEVRTVTLLHERPAEGILSYAREAEADLVAMSTRGLGGWRRMFLGSVADKVLRGAEQPVLLYHPVHEEGADEMSAAGASSEAPAVPPAFRP